MADLALPAATSPAMTGDEVIRNAASRIKSNDFINIFSESLFITSMVFELGVDFTGFGSISNENKGTDNFCIPNSGLSAPLLTGFPGNSCLI